ncbi:ribonuclease R [Parapedobacter deserti]|uniref:Ribonuclease R n=1 Tax=Parapedobacter deserti TaxID=1912957 RepID=A0ABV7JR37_9SPHI
MANKKTEAFKHILTQLISDVIEKSGNKPINYKQVAAKLNLTDPESRNAILDILQEEARAGLFKEVEKGKYVLKELKAFVTGRVDMTADGSAFIVPEDEFEDDIFIAPRKLRQALHGDRVKVHTYEKRRGKRKEGEVVEIIERARTEFTGTISISPRFAFFIADDRKMLHDIFVPLADLNGAQDGEKVVVAISEWPQDSKNPVGKVKHVLGKKGENNTEMNAILADFGFPLEFPSAVEKEAESFPIGIPESEFSRRRDFRSVTTFTIDPADAKDFDDAISFQQLPNGNYEIGVHIADVTHFVKPDSALDKEAFERGTSVYLVDRVIPMLPERLSNDLCSLRPHEDRLVFSAVFEMDKNANVINEWFGKGIIHSDRRFSYEEAQEILENKEGEFSTELTTLNELAYILRERKFKHGAISFETTEVKFQLDENGKPLGVYVKERKDAHKLIEDYMLLANKRVAEFIGKQGKGGDKKTFVYRVHDAPNPETIAGFAQFAARFGYKLNTKSDRETARSLNALMERVEGTKEQNVLTTLAIRSMAKAIYTTKKTSHYGLAFDYYTHFTSPIRRYPDVMVHRLLEFYLEGGGSVNAEAYEKHCEHASQMEKKAADAERASIKYKQAEYLQDQVGENYIGIISGVTEWGMYVEIEENKCEGMVRLRDITDDFYALDEKNYAIIGQRKKKRYQLGDEVQIRVKKVDLAKRQIDFTLVS